MTRGFRTRLEPQEVSRVRELLSPNELRLFAAMDPRERRHSVDVLRWLEVTAGSTAPSPDLLRAALLHDVGKGHLLLRDRVAFVLLSNANPRLLRTLAHPSGARWRRALWTLQHHAVSGAERLREAGADARVIALVAGHTSVAGPDAELARLIEADEAS